MPEVPAHKRPLWPITVAAFFALLYSAVDLFVGIKVFQLPSIMSQMPFPYNAIARAPEIQNFIKWTGNALLIFSTAFFLGGLGLLLKRKWGLTFAVAGSVGQILGSVYVAYTYYTKAYPVLEELFLLAGPPENAWLYDIGGVVFLTEMAIMVPEMILIFIFLLSSPKKYFSAKALSH
ncbi:MAG: hypothetical protein ACP5G4_09435 [bacterium]